MTVVFKNSCVSKDNSVHWNLTTDSKCDSPKWRMRSPRLFFRCAKCDPRSILEGWFLRESRTCWINSKEILLVDVTIAQRWKWKESGLIEGSGWLFAGLFCKCVWDYLDPFLEISWNRFDLFSNFKKAYFKVPHRSFKSNFEERGCVEMDVSLTLSKGRLGLHDIPTYTRCVLDEKSAILCPRMTSFEFLIFPSLSIPSFVFTKKRIVEASRTSSILPRIALVQIKLLCIYRKYLW